MLFLNRKKKEREKEKIFFNPSLFGYILNCKIYWFHSVIKFYMKFKAEKIFLNYFISRNVNFNNNRK